MNIYMHVFVFIYLHNKYTQYTCIYYVNKNFYFVIPPPVDFLYVIPPPVGLLYVIPPPPPSGSLVCYTPPVDLLYVPVWLSGRALC